MDMNKELSALQSDLKGYVEKAAEEKSQFGTMLTETKTAVDNLQKQIDAIDVKMADKSASQSVRPLVESLKENEGLARLIKDGRGTATISLKSADFERKTTLTETGAGFQTTGVLAIDRIPGITQEARQVLTVRDALYSRPTNLSVIDFVKVNTKLANATMTAEASAITENALAFTSASEKVRTIATFLPASRQILDDFTELTGYLQSALPYYVSLTEELQLLSGDGTGENLHGLITQASAYDTDLNAATDTKIDTIGHAITQLQLAKELKPTFVILNSADWWAMRLTKNTQGNYILGDPQTNVAPNLWGVPVIHTTSMTAGDFLVGSGVAPAAEIRDRMETVVEISTQHSDYFAKSLVAVRAEKRVALVVKRPGAFVTGSFPVPDEE